MSTLFTIHNARILLTFVGLVGALILPPAVPLVCILLLAFIAPAWEALVIGLFMDLLWYAPGAGAFLWGLPLYTIAAIVIVWGLAPLRAEFLR